MRFGHAAVVVAISIATTAAAEPTEADKDAARILFTQAKELRDAGKVLPALERFKRAHELAPTPITTLEFGRTHAMLGHLLEARRLYRSIEAMEVKPGESAKSTAAREEAKQLAVALDARIPTLVPKISSEDPLVSVTLDGRPLDLANPSQPVPVDPGKHVLTARAKGEASVTVDVAEGEHDRVVALFVPSAAVAPPPPPPTPRPVVTASPWTTVRWTALVVGGVGVLVGGSAGIVALSTASGLKDGCPGGVCPPSRHGDYDATRRWATVSNVGFGVAAVAATFFVVALVREPGKKDVGLTVVPYASATELGFTGHF